jgi:hypothetical protein
MMTTENFRILADPLEFHRGLKHKRQAAPGRRSFHQSKAGTEPETRLWKICAKAVSPRLSGVEWDCAAAGSLGAWGAGLRLFRVFPFDQQRRARPDCSRAPNQVNEYDASPAYLQVPPCSFQQGSSRYRTDAL